VSASSAPGFGPLDQIFSFWREVIGAEPDPSKVTGNAGSIALEASHLVHLDAGTITTSSPKGAATGGDITIDPTFVVLEHGSSVEAIADEGFGGHIQVAADGFFGFPGSRVSAASGNPELSGTVEIHSPDVNLAGTLAELPSTFLDAASQMRERCAARKSGERVGSFSVRGAGGIPAEPDGWLPAPLLADADVASATAEPPILLASASGPLLLARGCP